MKFKGVRGVMMAILAIFVVSSVAALYATNEKKQAHGELPTSFTVGDRTYEILNFLRGEETSVNFHTLVARAEKMNANLGEDDGDYLLDHQRDIPVSLRGKVIFVFTNWRHPLDSDRFVIVYWFRGQWSLNWLLPELLLDDPCRVLRRKQAHGAHKAAALPTFTVGDRTFEILGFFREGETSVIGHKVVERAVAMNANLGEDDGQYLLDHQRDIPVSLRGKVVFVFTNWRRLGSFDICYVYWNGDRWVVHWGGLGDRVDGSGRVLRRK